MRVVHAEPADDPDRRTGQQEPLPVLDAVARPRGSCTPRRSSCRRRSARSTACQDLTSDLAGHQPAGQRRHRPRQGGGPAASPPTRSRTRSTTRTARAGSRPSTRRSTNTKSCSNSRRSSRPIREALSLLYFKATPTGRAAGIRDAGNGGRVPTARNRDRRSARHAANATQVIGPQTVNHYGQLPAVTISFGLAPGASLGDVLSRVREVAAADAARGVSGQFQGAAKAFQSSLGNLAVLLVIAIMVVYIVLGILYESYIHPLTILSGLPSAGFGALLDAVHLPDGSQHLRVRRHDHADRHRREERDHADRLRARSGAPGHARPSRRSTRAA